MSARRAAEEKVVEVTEQNRLTVCLKPHDSKRCDSEMGHRSTIACLKSHSSHNFED